MAKTSARAWREAKRRALRQLETMTEEENAEIVAGAMRDPDNPIWPEDKLRSARPVEEVMPEVVAAWRRSRGRQKAPVKRLISLRLDPDVIDHFRATGDGWQSRINDALRKAARLKRKAG